METLEISSFAKALESLDAIMLRYKRDNYDADIRDAVIQRFDILILLLSK